MGQLWRGQSAWRILDTDFAKGTQFFKTWFDWQRGEHRPQLLHYVGLCDVPLDAGELEAIGRSHPQFSHLVKEIAGQWWGLLPGFHRLSLEQGQVLLTLCVGPVLPMLKAQRFEADEVFFQCSNALGEDQPSILKALARNCRRHAAFRLRRDPSADTFRPHLELSAAIARTGFQPTSPSALDHVEGPADRLWLFDPPWQIKKSRQGTPLPPVSRGSCVVIGAGLAGASVAAALARRGWQVKVLDQADVPAAGASGLPVGLVVPHVSRDDCVLSRLSRAGVRMMLQQADALLAPGHDWCPSGVFERQIDSEPQLPPQWPMAGLSWSQAMPGAAISSDNCSVGPGLWHSHGAWIKPAELVKAWLNQAGITFHGCVKVATLRQRDGEWHVLDDAGACVASANQVVLANAGGAFELLAELQQTSETLQGLKPNLFKTQAMRGLLTWACDSDEGQGLENNAYPAFPVNGSGSLIAGIPVAQSSAWFMGSSYQDAVEPERSDAANHAINLAHLKQLLPEVATLLGPAFESGRVKAWTGVRCITADRLPVVGPMQANGQSGLWVCAGMGSRGLSFSALCAELLAARMGGEPLPVEGKLADALDGMRGRSN